MPKYLKGLNQAVSMAWPLAPPRAGNLLLRRLSQDPKSEDTLILGPALWAEWQQESSPGGSRAWIHWTQLHTEQLRVPRETGWLVSPSSIILNSPTPNFSDGGFPGSCKHLPKPVPSGQGAVKSTLAPQGRAWSAHTHHLPSRLFPLIPTHAANFQS